MDLSKFESMDTIMLMSIINMKLRDEFGGDIDKLVSYYEINKTKLEAKLAQAGFEFLPEAGQFR